MPDFFISLVIAHFKNRDIVHTRHFKIEAHTTEMYYIAMLQQFCGEKGRDVRELHLAVALDGGEPDDMPALAELGVSELVLVEAPPEDPRAAADWVGALASRWKAASS